MVAMNDNKIAAFSPKYSSDKLLKELEEKTCELRMFCGNKKDYDECIEYIKTSCLSIDDMLRYFRALPHPKRFKRC